MCDSEPNRSPLEDLRDVVRCQICSTCARRVVSEKRQGISLVLPTIRGRAVSVPTYVCETGCLTFDVLPRIARFLRLRDPMLRSSRDTIAHALQSIRLPETRRNE